MYPTLTKHRQQLFSEKIELSNCLISLCLCNPCCVAFRPSRAMLPYWPWITSCPCETDSPKAASKKNIDRSRWDVSLATMDIQSANYLKIRIRRSNYDGSWTVTICHPFRPAQAGRHFSYLAEHLCHTCSWRIPSRYNHSHLKRRTRVGNSHWYILNIIIHDILCKYSSGARKVYTHLIGIFCVILNIERLIFTGLNWLQTLPGNPRWLTTGCERSNMAVMHLWHLRCTWNADMLWIFAFLTPKTPTKKCNASQQKEKMRTNSQNLAFTDRVRFNLGPFGTADFFAEVPCQLRSMVQVVPTTSTTSIVSQNSTWKPKTHLSSRSNPWTAPTWTPTIAERWFYWPAYSSQCWEFTATALAVGKKQRKLQLGVPHRQHAVTMEANSCLSESKIRAVLGTAELQ